MTFVRIRILVVFHSRPRVFFTIILSTWYMHKCLSKTAFGHASVEKELPFQ